MAPIKPAKCGIYDFGYVFNWIIDSFLSDPKKMEDNESIKMIRKGAMIIFTSYESELIGKPNSLPYKEEILKKIVNCREEAIDLLDQFNKNQIYGNPLDEKFESLSCVLRELKRK